MLIAAEKGAELIVSVGSQFDLVEFLDKNRRGMASTFLTRLRVGEILVDAKGVSRLYRPRPGAAPMLLLVAAGVIVLAAVVLLTPGLRDVADLLWLKLAGAARRRRLTGTGWVDRIRCSTSAITPSRSSSSSSRSSSACCSAWRSATRGSSSAPSTTSATSLRGTCASAERRARRRGARAQRRQEFSRSRYPVLVDGRLAAEDRAPAPWVVQPTSVRPHARRAERSGAQAVLGRRDGSHARHPSALAGGRAGTRYEELDSDPSDLSELGRRVGIQLSRAAQLLGRCAACCSAAPSGEFDELDGVVVRGRASRGQARGRPARPRLAGRARDGPRADRRARSSASRARPPTRRRSAGTATTSSRRRRRRRARSGHAALVFDARRARTARSGGARIAPPDRAAARARQGAPASLRRRAPRRAAAGRRDGGRACAARLRRPASLARLAASCSPLSRARAAVALAPRVRRRLARPCATNCRGAPLPFPIGVAMVPPR